MILNFLNVTLIRNPDSTLSFCSNLESRRMTFNSVFNEAPVMEDDLFASAH